MSWTKLPQELRDVILNELVQGKNVGYCASVCREWQRVIERHNFHSLKITSSSLAQFNIMATRNLKLIKYIWYCIELQEYDCTQCFWSESLGDIYANRKILGNGLRDIFVALRRRPLKGELTLDISVYSPSDSLHYFKDISFEPANGLPPTQLRTIKKILATHDPEHGWNHGYMTVLPSDEALDRLFSDFDFPDNFWRTVPRVPAVTSLLLRRQNRRRWDCVQLIPLFRCLPNLQEICYEPWRQWVQKPNQSYQDNCSVLLFKSLILNKLKRMTIFEDSHEPYLWLNEAHDPEPIRTACPDVIEALAEASLNLEHFSAAFIVDAGRFWKAHQSHWVWKELVSLSLTSRELVPGGSPEDINAMLHAAAGVAKAMPKLQTMELWNGASGHASVFRYKSFKLSRPASITWRGNWSLELEPRVTRAWEVVARTERSWEFQVYEELLRPKEFVRSHGDAIRVLALENRVACPVSVAQIQRENRLYSYHLL